MNELAMIVVNVFGGAVALDRAVAHHSWRRLIWVLAAAVLLTFAWGFSNAVVDDTIDFHGFSPLRPPLKGDRIRPYDQIIHPPWAVTRIA